MGEAELPERLETARRYCAERGAQLTEQRSEILELLLRRGGHAKAYDLHEDMQSRHGRVAPTTVYRALDFLMEQRLVHKVDATNTYAACTHLGSPHPSVMLVCTRCGHIEEWQHPPCFDDIAAQLQRSSQSVFTPQALEIKGLCGHCAPSSHPG